ncbi:MAG: phospholipase D-like domain-containing protein [Blastocatellia bacterium]
MRKSARKNGVGIKAYAGATGVIVAFNIDDAKRRGLLGFAVERKIGKTGEKEWLMGALPFPGQELGPDGRLPSNEAPIQKFRWSDYSVFPDTEYEFTAHPVYARAGKTPGSPNSLRVAAGPTVKVRTHGLKDKHAVTFNRAAAASQAFSRKFSALDKTLSEKKKAELKTFKLPAEALTWLTRDVLPQILNVIEEARDGSWALDVAIYEYELPEIVKAINDAHNRGVKVRVVYHAKTNDEQTAINEENLRRIPQAQKRARVTSKICHHKFIVQSRIEAGETRPRLVLCGSTNFTENGVYRQANVVHIARDPDLAGHYRTLFERLFEGLGPSQTKKFINENNPIEAGRPIFAGFSPRSGLVDLHAFASIINAARNDVLFCTAFSLFDEVLQSLAGKANDKILRFGLQNTRSEITGTHADRTAEFVAAAMLNKGLEGWLKESTAGQRGNILIHTKLVVVDFTSDAPTVISGSHNLSKPASEGNDENYLIIQGDTDIADAYGCELMRLYDHYRFRFRVNEDSKNQSIVKIPMLTVSDQWTDRYFKKGSLKMLDRMLFCPV